MNKLVTLFIAILATFRLSQLISKDTGPYDIFLNIRNFFGKRASGNKHYKTIADGINCPFCVGVYISVIIMFIPKKIRYILAISGGQSLLESLSENSRK